MDYEGQRLAELLFYWIILSFGVVGWVIGFFKQDFTVVFHCWLVGVVISVVVSSWGGGNIVSIGILTHSLHFAVIMIIAMRS